MYDYYYYVSATVVHTLFSFRIEGKNRKTPHWEFQEIEPNEIKSKKL